MDRRKFLHTAAGVAVAAGVLPIVRGGAVCAQSASNQVEEENKEISMKKIIIAADPFAVDLKDSVVKDLASKGYEIVDVGATKENAIPYYEGCVAACKLLQQDKTARGILFCGTGMGMSIVANRFDGIHASVVESVFAAKMCRAINNANVLCLGAMIWGDWMAKEAINVFLNTKFTEGLDGLEDFLKDAYKKVDAIQG
ncbi:MAG: RpiB/LacA/LacB family sugar-phosphate isomerase [Planctomycetia bacterium]|nr:RpiB/LacA/LacB family sugar-phosphate isomerase [Planctomycetia bacterium]